MRILFLIFICFSFLTGCGDKPVKTQAAPGIPEWKNLQYGGVTDSLSVPGRNGENIALFLPSTYEKVKNAGGNFPVIIFFDPDAKGSLPLNRYKDIAEKYHVILAGSNNSRNGQSFQLGIDEYNRIMTGLRQHVAINEKAVFLCGFSGGSKLAGYLATQIPAVTGVIACSGEFKLSPKPANPHFAWYGIAGKGDFNYIVMKNNHAGNLEEGIPSWFQAFEGKHEWAPADYMARAFVWCLLRAMKAGDIPADANFLETWYEALGAEPSAKNPVHTYETHAWALTLSAAADSSQPKRKEWEAVLQQNEGAWKKQMNEEGRYEGMEQARMKELADGFYGKDLNWWKGQIASMKKGAETPGASGWYQMRMLGFTGIVSYVYCSQAVSQAKPESDKLLDIYELAEPQNSEHAFLRAVLMGKRKALPAALESLKKAKALGFTDKARILREPALQPLQSQPEFQTLFP